jgi:hypothetical protein
MEKLTIKAYAVQHKLSIFNVVKLVKTGKLKTSVENENGKEITYIILDNETEREIKQGTIVSTSKSTLSSLEKEINLLKKELKLLREEIHILKKKL